MNIPIYSSSSSSPSSSSVPSSPPHLNKQQTTIQKNESQSHEAQTSKEQLQHNHQNNNDQPNSPTLQQPQNQQQSNDQKDNDDQDEPMLEIDQQSEPKSSPQEQNLSPLSRTAQQTPPQQPSASPHRSPSESHDETSMHHDPSPRSQDKKPSCITFKPITTTTNTVSTATRPATLTSTTTAPTTTTASTALSRISTDVASSTATMSHTPATTTNMNTASVNNTTTITTTTTTTTNTNTTSSTSSSSTNSTTSNIEQKRPMNAFLLFCQRQRSLVREKYPNLENRNITRILGDCWSKLDKEEKDHYTELARQHKEDFMKKNPDFKWCKTNTITNPIGNNPNHQNHNNHNNTNSINNIHNDNSIYSNSNIKNERMTDCHTANIRHNLKPLNSVLMTDVSPSNSYGNNIIGSLNLNNKDTLTNRQHEAPKPPKKRFLERNDSNYARNSTTLNNEPQQPKQDGIVPYLDQAYLNRVIDEVFSEKPNSTISRDNDSNMCKYPNPTILSTTTPIINHLSPSCATNMTPSNLSATTSSSFSSTSNNDEPVDYSMNRMFKTTSQHMINLLVEKCLEESDVPCNHSKPLQQNNTDSVMRHVGIAKRETKSDET